MGVLEEVNQMKSQGVSEGDIINSLRAKGIPPKEITDALGQSQIKNAVIGEEKMQKSIMEGPQDSQKTTAPLYTPKTMEAPQPQQNENYPPQQQSNTPEPQIENSPQPQYTPQMPQNYNPPQANYNTQPQDYQEQDYQGQAPYNDQGEEYYPDESYAQGGYAPASNTDTIIEIAEQVFVEKTRKIKKQIDENTEFKNLAETKIQNISDRLKRIEDTMDKLQQAILDKIGTYGSDLNSIKNEMGMMQDSFKKVVSEK